MTTTERKTAAKEATTRKGPGPQRRVLDGKPVVVLDEAEYVRLQQKADEWGPLPKPPAPGGSYPGEPFRASFARELVRQRRRLGLTQAALARKAGIRPETLNRLEHGRHTPTAATAAKIERALQAVRAEEGL
jgi:DNA-binding XRE family transcriptional regulator